MVGRKQVIHQAVPDGGGKGSSGSLPESRMLALALSSDTSPNHTASPCLPGKLLEAQGRRRMDAPVCVHRTPPIKATGEEQRVLWIRKLPIWEPVTSTEKEPEGTAVARLCTPPQVKGA